MRLLPFKYVTVSTFFINSEHCIFFLCVAYASNIGGTGSLIGSSPQLALKGIVQE